LRNKIAEKSDFIILFLIQTLVKCKHSLPTKAVLELLYAQNYIISFRPQALLSVSNSGGFDMSNSLNSPRARPV